MSKNIFFVLIFLILLLLSLLVYCWFFASEEKVDNSDDDRVEAISNFEDCVDAGYEVMESHPRKCRDDEGRLFIEDIVEESAEYYGSSSYYPCESDEDCITSGCNNEICMGQSEEPVMSICVIPDEPLPQDLGYSCGCFENKCQWSE